MREDKLTGREGAGLITFAIIGASLAGVPVNVYGIAGNAAWLATLLSGGIAVALFLLFEKMAGDRGLVEIGSSGVGRPLLFLLGLVLLVAGGSLFRSLIDATESYTAASIQRVTCGAAFGFAVLAAALSGIAGVARAARIAMPVALAICALVIFLAPEYEMYIWTNLFPIFGKGPGQVAVASLCGAVNYLFVLYPLFETGRFHGNRRATGVRAIVVATVVIALAYASCAMVFPTSFELTPYSIIMDLASIADAGRYIQRMRALFIMVWTGSMLAATTSLTYFASRAITRALGEEEHKYLIAAIVASAFVLATKPREVAPAWLSALLDARQPLGLLAFLPALALLVLGLVRTRKGAGHA